MLKKTLDMFLKDFDIFICLYAEKNTFLFSSAENSYCLYLDKTASIMSL